MIVYVWRYRHEVFSLISSWLVVGSEVKWMNMWLGLGLALGILISELLLVLCQQQQQQQNCVNEFILLPTGQGFIAQYEEMRNFWSQTHPNRRFFTTLHHSGHFHDAAMYR